MSLVKDYRLMCESDRLLARRVYAELESLSGAQEALAATRPERQALTRNCRNFSQMLPSSKECRSEAKRAGWVRHREELRPYVGAGFVSKFVFDICPMCAATVLPAPEPGE